jgi:hypothetical protein
VGEGGAEEAFDHSLWKGVMTGRVHILRKATTSHYRLIFVPGGPDRHVIESEDALRNFLLTDLAIPPGVTDTAMTELGKSGRYTIEDILVTDEIKKFWRLDTTPKPTSPEPKPTSPEPSKPAKRKPRQAVSRRKLAKPKPTRKAKRKGRSGR